VLLRPRLPSRLPRVVYTLAFPVILGCFALDLWLNPELLPSLVRLDLLLLSYRNLGYRGRREDLQLIVLGLFLVIVAGVLSVSPTFAVHLLLHGGCALGMLLVFTREAGGRPAGGHRRGGLAERARVGLAERLARPLLALVCGGRRPARAARRGRLRPAGGRDHAGVSLAPAVPA